MGDDLVNPEAWDGLRTTTSGPFALPGKRDEFVHGAENRPELAERARAIDTWLERERVGRLASYGVGAAALEWQLHRLRPTRDLIVTDYGQKTVARLREVFPEATAAVHDLFAGPVPADMHLFHRVDTELDNDAWTRVFATFADVPVLMVATEILDLKRFLLELRIRPLLRARHASRAGFLRTRSALEALWEPTHSGVPLRMYDLQAWALTPRGAPSHDAT